MKKEPDEFDDFAAECGGDEVPTLVAIVVIFLTMAFSTLIAYAILSLL